MAENQWSDVWSEKQIVETLKKISLVSGVGFQGKVDSTNLWARREALQGVGSGTLFVADEQSNGRGRFGRVWQSQPEEAIYFSLLLRPEIRPVDAPMLTMVMGLSVAQGVSQITGIPCGIKWPNDVVTAGKKICGILTEMSALAEEVSYVIIGVGVNVNNRSFSEELRDKATSLYLETGKEISRLQILQKIMECFEENYRIFLETDNLSGLTTAYHSILLNREREVRIVEKNRTYTGIARGITERGELLVETTDGVTHEVCAGEVSVRGLYSYV